MDKKLTDLQETDPNGIPSHWGLHRPDGPLVRRSLVWEMMFLVAIPVFLMGFVVGYLFSKFWP